MDVTLLLGIALFSFSALYFLFSYTGKFNTAFFVSTITLVSYVIMYDGAFLSYSSNGTELYWTRWLFYAFSCTLLVYEIARRLKKSPAEMTNMIYLTAVVMITGVLSSTMMDEIKWTFFAISSVVYLVLAYQILISKAKVLDVIKYYVLFGWSVFPIIFLLSPEGLDVIDNQFSAVIYLLLDFFTKIVFYIHLAFIKGKK